MIVGIDWTDIYSHTEKDEIVLELKGVGFVWADSDEEDEFGDPKSRFIGDDMIILDLENKEMWTGDWGTYVDLEVGLNFARFLGHKRFDIDD